MRTILTTGIGLAMLLAAEAAFAGRPDLIEINTGKQKLQGRAVAHNKRDFWLLGRDGRLHHLPIRKVKSFRSVAPRFRGYPAVDLRRRLLKELGKDFEAAGTVHYLVLAPKGRAKKFAAIFEDVYRTLSSHFSARRFRIKKPQYPLVAIVFPTRLAFLDYARRDGVNAVGMAGYYHRLTNRVALYDTRGPNSAAREPADGNTRTAYGRLTGMRGVQSQLFDIIVHEGTHQAAFNTGLHARLSRTPKWVVEGMATVFEAPGIRNRSGRRGARSRINRDQYLRFRNFMKSRRKDNSLEAFLASDTMFHRSVLDAYAQSWALSFYLIENRSNEYSRYLRLVAERNPLTDYTKKQRLDDFKKAFGNDLQRIENDFLKWIARLR